LLSLGLCAAIIVLWERSYRRCDVLIGEHGPRDRFEITSEFGVLVFEVEWPQRAMILPGWSYFENPLPRRFGKRGTLLGFAAYESTARHYVLLPPTVLWGATVPHWFVFVVTAIAPCTWIARRSLKRQRQANGHCQRCGYDLRATPERCPECGSLQTDSTIIKGVTSA